MVVAIGAAVALFLVRRRPPGAPSVRCGPRAAEPGDLALLCELTAIGLMGGLGVQSALGLAAAHVGGRLGDETADRLRVARIKGLAETMATAQGLGRRLYVAVGRVAASGASALDPVSRLADDLHAELAAERLQEVRKRPVTMLFPLTLLVLPGFLLLTVAPAIVGAFDRLSI